ncbi:hypothetical protein WA538_001516, partial [Blastocystis sp. DL]
MSATETQNVITLRGSAQMVAEFFDYSINTILYQRGLYPPESFNRVTKYGLSMVMVRDESLSRYIQNMITQVRYWLESDVLRNLILVIYGMNSHKVLERWSFAVETDPEVSQSKGAVTREKELSVIQKEIQAIIRQITASMTFLPLLDEPCSFEILVYTDKNAEVPLKWEDSDPRFIPNAETVKLRSFSTNIHTVDTAVSYQQNSL